MNTRIFLVISLLFFATSSDAQIMFDNNGCLVDYGQLFTWWTNWGENITQSTTSSSTATLINFFTSAPNIGSVDGNYWGANIDPDNNPPCTAIQVANGHWNTGNCSEVDCNVPFTVAAAHALSPAPSRGFTVTCNGAFGEDGIKPKENKIFSQSLDTPSCTYLRGWRHASTKTKDLAQEIYDSVRFYINHCAANDSEAFMAFTHLDGAVGLLYTYSDSTLYTNYRNWLISVLYLNTTDPRYFCDCMSSIMGTYGITAAGDKYNLPNGGLAVMNYLRGKSQCNIGHHIDSLYAENVRFRHQEWLDGDRKMPEDTTLPSLDKIGLGFLLKGVVTPSNGSVISSQFLASFTSNPNPFKNETTLDFILNRMTYTTIAVYDELGRLVWGDGRGSL